MSLCDDTMNYMLQSPLYGAAKGGHAAVVEILLKAGADKNYKHVSECSYSNYFA